MILIRNIKQNSICKDKIFLKIALSNKQLKKKHFNLYNQLNLRSTKIAFDFAFILSQILFSHKTIVIS